MNFVLSMNFYDWIIPLGEEIYYSNAPWEVIILCHGENLAAKNYKRLCTAAIYEQRRHDVFTVGKYLGIDKISSMNLDYPIEDIPKLAIQLRLKFLFGVQKIYYQEGTVVEQIVVPMIEDRDILSPYKNREPISDFEHSLSSLIVATP